MFKMIMNIIAMFTWFAAYMPICGWKVMTYKWIHYSFTSLSLNVSNVRQDTFILNFQYKTPQLDRLQWHDSVTHFKQYQCDFVPIRETRKKHLTSETAHTEISRKLIAIFLLVYLHAFSSFTIRKYPGHTRSFGVRAYEYVNLITKQETILYEDLLPETRASRSSCAHRRPTAIKYLLTRQLLTECIRIRHADLPTIPVENRELFYLLL